MTEEARQRDSKDKKHRITRIVAALSPFILVVAFLYTSVISTPRTANAQASDAVFGTFLDLSDNLSGLAQDIVGSSYSMPTSVQADVPASKKSIFDKIKAQIMAILKVAGDVAYKTSVRIFYQQLANVTTEFIRTAGTGEKPIFVTDPHYWENVFEGAQNDFLDSVSQDVFGVDLAAPDAEKQKQIGLFVRGILNPGTVCEDNVSKSYNESQANIALIQKALDKANQDNRDWKNEVKKSGGKLGGPGLIFCPLVGDPTKDPRFTSKEGEGDQIDPNLCIGALESILSEQRALATKAFTNGMKACRNSRAAVRTDPILKEMVGNEAIAAAVQEYYDPRKNDFGNVLELLNKAADKSQSAVAAEQAAYNTKIGPTRTVAGLITAPAVLVEEYTKKGLQESTDDVDIVTGSRIADVVSKAIGNALIQRIMREWFKSKCGLSGSACVTKPVGSSTQSRIILSSGTNAQVAKVQLGKTSIIANDPSRSATPSVDQIQAEGIIDQKFRQAVDEGITVREAIDRGLLDGTKTFGFDQSNNIAIDGYSYQTILYLRKARVVPVGWQLAAEYKFTANAAPSSLDELASQFDVCGQDEKHDYDPRVTKRCVGGAKADTLCSVDGDCNVAPGDAFTCGEKFTASPYCGLVDPEWVLKAPLSYCKKQGAGEEVITKIFICDNDTNGNGRLDCSAGTGGGDIGHWDIQRNTDTCADEPTCVAENEDGSCLSYGYCFEDRRSWKFDGNQCPAYYNSCMAYTDSNGITNAYLKKTLDVNGCSSDNAGCYPYCGDRNLKDKKWLCVSDPGIEGPYTQVTCPVGETCTCRNPDGESCDITDGSGSCVLPASGMNCLLGTNYTYLNQQAEQCDPQYEGCRSFINANAGTNLAANGDFETYDGTADDGIPDTVKGWAPVNAGASPQVVTSALPSVTSGNRVAVELPAISALDDALFLTNERPAPAPGNPDLRGIDTGRPLSFQNFTVSYYGKAVAGSCGAKFGARTPDGTSVFESPTDAVYTPDWQRYSYTFTVPDLGYDNTATEHLLQPYVRYAPCAIDIDAIQLEVSDAATGYVDYGTTNNTYLNGKRRICERVDVGCDRYAPTVGGDPITGVVNPKDRCLKEDVGCRQYRKEAIDHVPQRPAVDPINLVPASGKKCLASEVGCEEYTNLDKLAAGGEAREYYTSIKQCVKPVSGAADQATYFSWVGDDRSGFQLRSFRMKVSNLANYAGETGSAPCTNLTIGSSATDNNPACDDHGSKIVCIGGPFGCTLIPANVALCTAADIGVNPDCVEYFDSTGNVFYRLQSRTIPISDSCRPYRNTIDEKAGDDKIYLILEDQSTTCSAGAAMCRAFTGNAGNNITTVAKFTFEESNAVASWSSVGGGSAVGLSNESLNPQGHSLSVTGTVVTNPPVILGKVKAGKSYTLSFWAKPSDPAVSPRLNDVFVDINSGAFHSFVSNLNLASEWHNYEVGPITIPETTVIAQVVLGFDAAGAGGPTTVFVDNVQLQEVQDSVYLIDGSYRTCADANIGCKEYTDSAKNVNYLKSFTRLCKSDAVGCSAVIDTQNSSSPFMSLPIHGVSVPNDVTSTYVVEKNALCNADNVGCTALGQPILDVNKKVKSYETVYLKDNADRHLQILCGKADLFCSAYTAENGSVAYFKDPGSQTCEFKRLGGDKGYHWYITGTTMRCPYVTPPADTIPSGRSCVRSCGGGSRDGLACVTDAECPDGVCRGADEMVGKSCTVNDDCRVEGIDIGMRCDTWVGKCPAEQSGCNEYRDPTDPNPCRSTCSYETQSGRVIYYDSECMPTSCVGGARNGASCRTDTDCPGLCAGGSNKGLACTYDSQCPLSNCTKASCSAEGIPGCRSYYYIRDTVESNAAECSGRIDLTKGCRPFNDTSNSTLNYRSF